MFIYCGIYVSNHVRITYASVCLPVVGDCLLSSLQNVASPKHLRVQFNTTFVYRCVQNFLLNGTGNSTAESITCFRGVLSSVPPGCAPVKCPRYEQSNDAITMAFQTIPGPIDTSIGTFVNYSCISGHQFQGPEGRECQLVTSGTTAVGKWSSVACFRKLYRDLEPVIKQETQHGAWK